MQYRFAAACCGLLLICATPLSAQTTLRWKLTPGENLAVAISQTTTSAVSYAGKTTETEIKLDMELRWRVLSADNGQFRLEQSIQQLSVSLDAPPAGRVAYDSAKAEKPTGSAKDLAAALAPLLAAKVEITMNDRGEVLDAKSTETAPANPPAANTSLSKETIQQLLKQPLAVLPEAAKTINDTWTGESQLKTSLGPAKQTTTYKYVGPVELEGQKLEKIDSEAKLQLNSPAGTKLTVKSQSQTGEVWFDPAAGRVARAKQHQKLVTERPYRETTIVVSLTSDQTTTVGPAKETANP